MRGDLSSQDWDISVGVTAVGQQSQDDLSWELLGAASPRVTNPALGSDLHSKIEETPKHLESTLQFWTPTHTILSHSLEQN